MSVSDESAPRVETESVLALAQSYVELGRRLSGHGVAEILQTLTSLGCRQVAGAEDAGITRFHRGTLETIGATSELVSSTDKLQYTLLSGPCIEAVLGEGMFHTGELRSEARWPQFGPQAFEATGVRSMLSYRLFVEEQGDAVTCLNFYSTKPHAFDLWSQTIALLLARHGALALANARAQERNENLKVALASNRQIAMAIGILMKAHQSTPEDALALLRISSQHSNRKMAKIAADVVATGELSLPPQAGPTPGKPLQPS